MINGVKKINAFNLLFIFRGVCTLPPAYCIIMEFCPFGSLNEIIKEEEIISPTRLISWSKQIAEGMQYLHANKIIHRDLKSPK